MLKTQAPVARVQIDLENSSSVRGRGVLHIEWEMRLNDAWVSMWDLHAHPTTRADFDTLPQDAEDPRQVIPSQTQYRITHHLMVPVGTRLRRRMSYPRTQINPLRKGREGMAPIGAVLREIQTLAVPLRQPLKTVWTEFRVTGAHKAVSERKLRRQLARRAQPREPRVQGPFITAEQVDAFVQTLKASG